MAPIIKVRINKELIDLIKRAPLIMRAFFIGDFLMRALIIGALFNARPFGWRPFDGALIIVA